jgi:hypothetical protein
VNWGVEVDLPRYHSSFFQFSSSLVRKQLQVYSLFFDLLHSTGFVYAPGASVL